MRSKGHGIRRLRLKSYFWCFLALVSSSIIFSNNKKDRSLLCVQFPFLATPKHKFFLSQFPVLKNLPFSQSGLLLSWPATHPWGCFLLSLRNLPWDEAVTPPGRRCVPRHPQFLSLYTKILIDFSPQRQKSISTLRSSMLLLFFS